MDLSSNREERFVSKLIQDTKKGELEWKDESNNVLTLPSNERPISKVYTTEIVGKNLRIYEFEIKHYSDEYEWDWVERIRLELIDDDGATLFEFDYDYSIYKLFNAVRKLNSGIDDLMKEFLNE
ncbi:MAG TPA: hypothetical protein PLH70_07485 [Bacteroidales bacterium]|nr:hypothetical protein [Bacteroidales bacterium]HOH22908.1 hypothetical protein [Bacteroidales bacterium]HPZ04179.1 hypothetical protein [Bacteroidales bacterium]HQB75624.1 hypothetical protein [Bacteroidales bacterium]